MAAETDGLTQSDIERKLHEKKSQIEQRLTALQKEVTSIVPSARSLVTDHPFAILGGALAGGIIIGLLLGGRARPEPARIRRDRAPIDRHVVPVLDAMRDRIANGADVEDALRSALKDHLLLDGTLGKGFRRDDLALLRQLVPLGLEIGARIFRRIQKTELADQAAGEQGA